MTVSGRTVLDLVGYGEDLSLVAAVLRDFEAAGAGMVPPADVNARVARCGFPDGFDLYGYLREQ